MKRYVFILVFLSLSLILSSCNNTENTNSNEYEILLFGESIADKCPKYDYFLGNSDKKGLDFLFEYFDNFPYVPLLSIWEELGAEIVSKDNDNHIYHILFNEENYYFDWISGLIYCEEKPLRETWPDEKRGIYLRTKPHLEGATLVFPGFVLLDEDVLIPYPLNYSCFPIIMGVAIDVDYVNCVISINHLP